MMNIGSMGSLIRAIDGALKGAAITKNPVCAIEFSPAEWRVINLRCKSLLILAAKVADHFEGTDAPLGADARLILTELTETHVY